MTESRNWSNRSAGEAAQQRSERRSRPQGDWSDQQRAAAAAQNSAQTSGASYGEIRQSSGRNRAYSDDARNRAYSDPSRNQDYRQDRREVRRDDRQAGRDGNRVEREAYREGWQDSNRQDRWRTERRAYNGDHRRWDRDWRRNDRYDWSRHRSHNRQIYRAGRYYAPYSGYHYRRLSIGFTLGSVFYSNRYWINDPWQYRLPPAYGPYRWVRYYDDALLIDMRSGEVVDAIHNFFW